VQLNPAQAESLHKCAEVMEKGPAPEFALPFLEKLVNLQPLNADYRFRLAVQMLNHYRRQEGLRHILQFLFTSDDSHSWDRVEGLKLSEPEWQFLLDAVLDYSRKAENQSPPGITQGFAAPVDESFVERAEKLVALAHDSSPEIYDVPEQV
jgi:hypothetical protein